MAKAHDFRPDGGQFETCPKLDFHLCDFRFLRVRRCGPFKRKGKDRARYT